LLCGDCQVNRERCFARSAFLGNDGDCLHV
jgi:hypothetical protein